MIKIKKIKAIITEPVESQVATPVAESAQATPADADTAIVAEYAVAEEAPVNEPAGQSVGRRGRPKGAKNKPKAVLTASIAEEVMKKIQERRSENQKTTIEAKKILRPKPEKIRIPEPPKRLSSYIEERKKSGEDGHYAKEALNDPEFGDFLKDYNIYLRKQKRPEITSHDEERLKEAHKRYEDAKYFKSEAKAETEDTGIEVNRELAFIEDEPVKARPKQTPIEKAADELVAELKKPEPKTDVNEAEIKEIRSKLAEIYKSRKLEVGPQPKPELSPAEREAAERARKQLAKFENHYSQGEREEGLRKQQRPEPSPIEKKLASKSWWEKVVSRINKIMTAGRKDLKDGK